MFNPQIEPVVPSGNTSQRSHQRYNQMNFVFASISIRQTLIQEVVHHHNRFPFSVDNTTALPRVPIVRAACIVNVQSAAPRTFFCFRQHKCFAVKQKRFPGRHALASTTKIHDDSCLSARIKLTGRLRNTFYICGDGDACAF
uniref:ORF-89 n=1 Tax=Buzura suppressaria nuclear polyhedrosis virus TaxID=74320 RepID=A0A0N7CUD1_NPVBS|nr:ORF-89 [Buzura suppressaria nucleopolyhedrovirus]